MCYNNNNKIYLFEILRGIASAGLFCIQHKSTTTDLQNQQKHFVLISSIHNSFLMVVLWRINCVLYKFDFCDSQMKQVLYPS